MKNNLILEYKMSVRNILTSSGVISNEYLPTAEVATFAEVLSEGNTSGANDAVFQQSVFLPSNVSPDITLDGSTGIITCASMRVLTGESIVAEIAGNGQINASSVVIALNGAIELDSSGTIMMNGAKITFDEKTEIVASETTPDTLELVAVDGATVNITDKINSGQVYDTHFNRVSTIPLQTNSTTANTISNGVSVPMTLICDRTGLYALQFGYELGTGGTGMPSGCILSIYDSELPSTSALAVQSYMNTGAIANTAPGLSITTDTFELTSGETYNFYYSVSGGPISLSTINDGEFFFKLIQYC